MTTLTVRYAVQLQNSISILINTLSVIRLRYSQDPDGCLKALDAVEKSIFELRRSLLFIKNTNVQTFVPPQLPVPPKPPGT